MAIGKRVGYIRVSTYDQNPDRQLVDIPLDRKFIDYASAKDTKRPQLQAMLDYIREDDEIFVHSTDRLARSVKDLHNIVDLLIKKGVKITFVKQNLVFRGSESPMEKFQLSILGAVAELEREIILERIKEGIEEAKKAGKYRGSEPKLKAEDLEYIKEKMMTRCPIAKIAFDLNVSRMTIYRYLKILGIQTDRVQFKKTHQVDEELEWKKA